MAVNWRLEREFSGDFPCRGRRGHVCPTLSNRAAARRAAWLTRIVLDRPHAAASAVPGLRPCAAARSALQCLAPQGWGIQTRLMRRQGWVSADPEPSAGRLSIRLARLSRIGTSFGQDHTDHGVGMVGQRHCLTPIQTGLPSRSKWNHKWLNISFRQAACRTKFNK